MQLKLYNGKKMLNDVWFVGLKSGLMVITSYCDVFAQPVGSLRCATRSARRRGFETNKFVMQDNSDE